eukprot:jgi/Botrbrau1/6006/Bobra.104_1s0034.2
MLMAEDPLTQAGWNDVSTGARTPEGNSPLDIPMAVPRYSYLLLGINLAVYGVGVYLALAEPGTEASNDFFLALAKINSLVVQGEWYRMLTSMFLHAGLLHLGLNSLALAQLGPEAEALLGHFTFLTVYLGAGLAGSTASFLLSDLTTVGASSAIFGLLGALGAYFLKNRSLQNAGWQLVFIFGIALLNFGLGTEESSLIDNTGHVAGFICGLALGYLMAPKLVVLREPGVPDRATSLTAWTGNPSSAESSGSDRPTAGAPDRAADQVPGAPDQATAPDQASVPDEAAPPDWIIVMDQTTRLQRLWAASLGLLVVGAMFAAGLILRSAPLSA